MQNVWSNLNFNTQSFQQNDNHSWSSYSNQSGPLGSNHGFYDSGPTSLPCFQTRLEVNTTPSCTWFEMSTNKKCFSKAREGTRQPSQPSSLTMFGQSWSARRDSTASSKQASLGSQEWGELVDEVILDEMNAMKENIGSLSNKLPVF